MSLVATLSAPSQLPLAPSWLHAHQRSLGEQFSRYGLPSKRQEQWKYTSLKVLEQASFEATDDSTFSFSHDQVEALAVGHLDVHRLVFVNGHYVPALSDIGALGEGVRLNTLAQAQGAEWAPFQAALMSTFEQPSESLAAWNGARLSDGLLLQVAAGVKVDRPLYLLCVGAGAAVASALRHVIRLDAGAELKVIEHFVGQGQPAHFTHVLKQVELGSSARMHHWRIQDESDQAFLITRSDINQAQASRYRYNGFDLGGRLVRHDVNVRLQGGGSGCQLSGIYMPDGVRHIDNHVCIEHAAADTDSQLDFKGVLRQRGRAVFNGKVVVRPGADGTDATQTNANLLLSPQAEIDTKPELEIYADDVKCAHGATVGQLDAAQMFYLRSRGIPLEQARQLLTYAFCRSVVDQLEHDTLRQFVAEKVMDRLPQNPQAEILP